MQKVENLHYETSDQHKESTKSRQERDNKDLMTVVNFLNERNPFIEKLVFRRQKKWMFNMPVVSDRVL